MQGGGRSQTGWKGKDGYRTYQFLDALALLLRLTALLGSLNAESKIKSKSSFKIIGMNTRASKSP
jgi:hypothetical protein